jgi:hypothetical protein
MNTQDTAAQALDATIATIGWHTAKVGAAGTFFGWLLSSQGAAVVGIIGVVGGLTIQLIFRWRQDKREQAEHERRMGLYE